MGDLLTDRMVLLVAAAEVAFWTLLGAGLAARYRWHARRLSTVLLAAVPLLALALVGGAVADVAAGRPPGTAHGLAALYLGFTVAFGPATIRWADTRAARRAAARDGRPAPVVERADPVRRAWRRWVRVLASCVVTVAVCALVAWAAGTALPVGAAWATDPLWSSALQTAVVTAVWFVAGPLRATGRRERAGAR